MLSYDEIEAILRTGHIGPPAREETFPEWLDRADQCPLPEAIRKFAEHLYTIGLKALHWEDGGTWKHDERVSVTYLVATPVGQLGDGSKESLPYLSHCYDWIWRSNLYAESHGWYAEIWFEYHSADRSHRDTVLRILEDARIGEISYPILLRIGGASTDVGVLATLLTANGIFDIRVESEAQTSDDQCLSSLVVNLRPGEVASNPNIPPLNLAFFVASMLRNPTTYFFMKTEIWVPFHVKLPIDDRTQQRIQQYREGDKWWR